MSKAQINKKIIQIEKQKVIKTLKIKELKLYYFLVGKKFIKKKILKKSKLYHLLVSKRSIKKIKSKHILLKYYQLSLVKS